MKRSRFLPPSLSLAISPFFPRGLAAASVASAWCSIGRNASFVRARVARGGGDTKRTRIEIETERQNEIERNGGSEFTLLLVNPFAFHDLALTIAAQVSNY